MPDDLERRAIIAAHRATCDVGCEHDPTGWRGLRQSEAAIVALWREDRERVLQQARKVITQYLATAEQWRYDRVVWAFAVMLGEIPEDTPEPPVRKEEVTEQAAREVRGAVKKIIETADERNMERDRAEKAEAEVKRLQNVISMAEAGGMHILDERNEALAAIEQVRAIVTELDPSHWKAVSNRAITDDYERGRVHAEDDLCRRLGAALDVTEATP